MFSGETKKQCNLEKKRLTFIIDGGRGFTAFA
jgi:hypothetical protein